ncbi:hypothetical protein COJ14_23140 [Bacillus cereus]|nr:hypothetical protein COJ14_23140 [Bacillus cereus]
MDSLIKQIRIAGLKYAKMQKQYKNTLLPFHRDGEPVNTLITLVNMGGKGVLLQAIFQLLDPLIRWGKEEKMVDSFFFNDKRKFVPYSFHVLIEWLVGWEPHTKIMTGIAVSAKPKISNKRDASPIEPEYLLYIVEQNEQTPFDIASIPVWNEDTQIALSIDDLKNYLKKHEDHVKTFNRNQKREYFFTLKNYGIDPNEWRVLKSINKDEGDVSAFFARANDNHSLMSNLIIPTLDKQIEPDYKKSYVESKSLAETFKDVAIANQEMPKLLERELTYKIMMDELTPVAVYLKKCAELEKKLLEHRKNGYIIKEFMKGQVQIKVETDKEIAKKLEGIENQLQELKWESANLGYANAFQKVSGLEQEINSLSVKYEEVMGLLTKEKGLFNEYTVKLRLFEHAKLNKNRDNKRQQYNELKNLLEIDDSENEIKKFKGKLKNNWDLIQGAWSSIKQQHLDYMKLCDEEIKKDKLLLKNIEDSIKGLETKIIQIKTLLEVHEKKKEELQGLIGEMVADDPHSLLDNLNLKKQSLQENYDVLITEQNNLQTEKSGLLLKKGKSSAMVSSLNKKIKDLNWDIQLKSQKEKALIEEISDITNERVEAYSKEVMGTSIKILEKLCMLTENTIDSKSKERWSLESQYDLLKDSDYWIPNKDIVLVKEQISSQGITCELAMEILYQMLDNLGEELTKIEIEKYPLFPYGVVVHSEDLEHIDFSFLEKQYYQSPVPIFVRGDMKNHGADMKQEHERLYPFQQGSFVAIDGWLHQALDLYSFREKKIELDKKLDDYAYLVDHQKEYVARLKTLIGKCKLSLSEPDSHLLLLDRNGLAEELQVHTSLLQTISDRLPEIDMETKENAAQLEKIKNDLGLVKDDIKVVTSWIEEMKGNKLLIKEKTGIHNQIKSFKEQYESMGRVIRNNDFKAASYREDYKEWKGEAEEQFKLLVHIFPWIENPLNKNSDFSVEKKDVQIPTYRTEEIDLLRNEIFKYNSLNNEIEKKNFDLQAISNDIRHLDEKILDIQIKLDELDKNWRTLTAPKESKNVIAQSIQIHEKNATEFKERADNLKMGFTKKQGTKELADEFLQNEKTNVMKINPTKKPENWSEIDLDEKDKEIKRNLQQVLALKRKTEDARKINQGAMNTLNINITQLEDMDLEKTDIKDFNDIEWLQGIKENYLQKASSWTKEFTYMSKQLQKSGVEFKAKYDEYRRAIAQTKNMDREIVSRVDAYFDDINTQDYLLRHEGVNSILESFEVELQKIRENKNEGLAVLKQWTDRATYRVNLIVKKMKQMVHKMKIKNYQDHSFPLVKYSNHYKFNESLEQYSSILTDFFIKVLDELQNDYEDINDVSIFDIEKRIEVSILVLKVLGNQYPTLFIYNPGGKNHLLYEKPRDSYYSDWETIMHGDYAEASGSGGQKLMTQMIIMAMLMKSNKKGWSVLISDNPFSKMVSEHVITPIFALCELLKIQWIVVSPPELTSTFELTRRFPVIHRLSFTRDKGKDFIQDDIQMNTRIYIDKDNILNEKRAVSE